MSLHAANKKLFLIVDELDQLYRCKPDAAGIYYTILDELKYYGNSLAGNVAVVASSSLTSLEMLIEKNAVVALQDEFPLLPGATSLKGSKYTTNRPPQRNSSY